MEMDPNGSIEARVTSTESDGRGLPWVEGRPGPGGHQARVVKEYDPNGNLRRDVNPKGLTDDEDDPVPAYVDTGASSGDNLRDATKNDAPA